MTPLNLNALAIELVGVITDGVVIADAGGAIISWNAGAASIFGYTADEALGQSLDLVIPERLRARRWAGFASTHRDGRQLSIEFRVALLGMVEGKPSAIGAVIRDVTERWNEQRQPRARLAEFEAAAE